MAANGNVRLYGTGEAAAEPTPVRLGPLSFLYSAEAVRRICWHGTELVRAVTWPVRDENWGTYAPAILDEWTETGASDFSAHIGFSVAEGRLECALAIRATDAGELHFNLTMTPAGGPFATNRAGFTVLHPIRGIAGAPLEVTHSDGQVERTRFPALISPGQPVFDIQELRYASGGAAAEVVFSGEVFEMEDQRNWSDASYKTYCVPLVHPFTYTIDRTATQSVRVAFTGSGAATTGGGDLPAELETAPSSGDTAPAIGLVAEPGWLKGDRAPIPEHVTHICARMGAGTPARFLADLSRIASGRSMDFELVLDGHTPPRQELAAIAARIDGAGLSASRVTALPASYLASHQPSGPWPDGPTPMEVAEAAREIFPRALIGGGMLTNFTEFNRCRPDPARCDFITHANTAIVHAGDDLSVRETLETLPQIFESAHAIGGDLPYRLGLVSIGMRSNPYGAAVAENPKQIRRTMAREDPRQRGLFAAAWAVGVLAATEAMQVEALCLAAPSGPFGIAYAPQPCPQPYFDETAAAAIYPLYHVVRSAAAMAGQPRLSVSGAPEGVFAYGVVAGTGGKLMLANVSPDPVSLRLAMPGRAAILDQSTFTDATEDADWLDKVPRHDAAQLDLEGFAVAFID